MLFDPMVLNNHENKLHNQPFPPSFPWFGLYHNGAEALEVPCEPCLSEFSSTEAAFFFFSFLFTVMKPSSWKENAHEIS